MILHALRTEAAGAHGAGPGDAPPLVLLHGLFGAASNWGRIQRRMSATRTVLALDARNHGASPHGLPSDYATMAADVLDTVAAQGIGRFALLGHSMGGKIAMAVALSRPEAVERLLLADIAPARYEPHFRTVAAAMRALPLRPGLTRAEAGELLRPAVPEDSVRAFLLQNLRFTDPPGWRIGLDEIAAALPDIEDWPLTGRYDGPTLVLRGERSDYVLPEHRPLFRTLFPRVRFAALRDAGHWLHADAPDAFLATVSSFFSPAA